MFQTTLSNVTMHIKNILKEGELEANPTIKDFLIVQKEGNGKLNKKIMIKCYEN